MISEEGKTLNVLSAFSENSKNADKKAFEALMKHIKEVDHDYTVIMMQVENDSVSWALRGISHRMRRKHGKVRFLQTS